MPRAAVPYLAAAALTHALPLVYEPEAMRAVFAGEVVVAGSAYVVLGAVLLVSKRQLADARRQAQRLSLTDPLTGLPNRRALGELLDAHVGGERREDALGLLIVDVDNFKEANTLLGHPGGDRVLRAVGEAIRSAARDGDMVSRLGGDEFAVVARGASERAMALLAGRVLDAVRAVGDGIDVGGYRVRANAGWALYPENAATVDDLAAAADLALSGAKVSGKDRSQSPFDWLPEPASA